MGDNTTKTVLGLTENIEAVLCYMLGWLTGIIFLILGKKIVSLDFMQYNL